MKRDNDNAADQYGFRWGQLDVVRLAEFKGTRALSIRSDFGSIEVYVSPTEPGKTRVWIRPGIAGTVRMVIDSQRIDVDWDDGLTTVVRLDATRVAPLPCRVCGQTPGHFVGVHERAGVPIPAPVWP